jgi:hypothetical protein
MISFPFMRQTFRQKDAKQNKPSQQKGPAGMGDKDKWLRMTPMLAKK